MKRFIALALILVPLAARAASGLLLGYPVPAPDIAIDFAGNFSPQGAIPGLVSVTRAQTKWCDDVAGHWFQAAANTLCYTNKGALIEEAATNQPRNTTFVGAVAGSPGTFPTNWVQVIGGGITRVINVIGTDPATNVKYFSVTLTGTLGGSGTQTIWQASYDSNTQVAATNGQTWNNSAFVAASSLTGVNSTFLGIAEYNTGGTLQQDHPGTSIQSSLTSTLQRFSFAATLLIPATTKVNSYVMLTGTGGATINATILVGQPQEENRGLVTNVASASVNVAGSGYTLSASGTMTWNSTGCGSGTSLPVLNVTTDGTGVINAVTGVATPGSCGTFPPNGSTLWLASASLGAGSGASFLLTPNDKSAQSFASSIIPTINASVLRNADVVKLASPPTIGSRVSLFSDALFTSPLVYPNSQNLSMIDDGTFNNSFTVVHQGNTGQMAVFTLTGGVSVGFSSVAVFGPGQSARIAGSIRQGIMLGAVMGVNAFGSVNPNYPSGMNDLSIGGAAGGTSQRLQGYLKNLRAWYSQALPQETVRRVSQ